MYGPLLRTEGLREKRKKGLTEFYEEGYWWDNIIEPILRVEK